MYIPIGRFVQFLVVGLSVCGWRVGVAGGVATDISSGSSDERGGLRGEREWEDVCVCVCVCVCVSSNTPLFVVS